MGNFIGELKRRNVVRVAVFYGVTAWLILQAGDVLFALLGLPDWTLKLVLGVLVLGMPIALVFSWIFEMTPEGIKLEKDVDRSSSVTPETGRKLNNATLVVAIVAIVLVLVQQTGLMPSSSPAQNVPESVAPLATLDKAPELPIDARPSVAVLPFVDMSPQKDQEYFSDGLADTLMHVLAQVKGLKVAARTSSFAFKGKSMDVAKIADQLGVGTILEGSVQKAGDKIRVIAQLIDANDGSHLWSKNFDRDLEDIFAVQDEIAQEVVKALSVTLLDGEQTALASRYQPTLEAYEQFILGRREMATRKIERLEIAVEHFKTAVERDPNYALAYVNLADSYSLIQFYGDLETEQSNKLRRPLLDQALELQPLSGEAYASLAQTYWDEGIDSKAEDYYLRAIELAPNYATAYHWYAVSLRRQDRYEEALAMIRKAAELDPMSPIIRTNVTETLFDLGRIEEAEVLGRENVARNPEFANHLFDMSAIMRAKGKIGESQRWRDAMAAAAPGQSGTNGARCAGYLDLADVSAASACFDKLRLDFPGSSRAQLAWAAEMLVHQGEYARAAGQFQAVMERLPATTLEYRYAGESLAWIMAIDGKLDRAREILASVQPELFVGDLPGIGSENLFAAGLAAWLQTQFDNGDRAVLLLDRLEAWMAARHRVRGGRYGLEDAAAQMVRGRQDQALVIIRQAIDEKWRDDWWFYFRHDPRFKPLHDNEDFLAMVAEVEADMLAQQAWYEEHKNEPLL
jgi:TolB-like protein/Tfp pilus assembly protein PilF